MASEISSTPLAPTANSEIGVPGFCSLDSACEPLLESIQKEETIDVHTLNKCKEDQTSLSPSSSKQNSQHGLNESETPDGIPEPLPSQNAQMFDTTTAAKGCQFCRKSVSVYCKSDKKPPNISPGDHIEVPMKGRLGILKHHAIVESFQYLDNGKAIIKVIDVAYKNKKHRSLRRFFSRGEMDIQSHNLQDESVTDLTKVRRVQYSKRLHNESETLQRAKQCLQDFNSYTESISSNHGQSSKSRFKYNLLFRNCESFAVFCACGTENINKLSSCVCLQFLRFRAILLQITFVLFMTTLLTLRSDSVFTFKMLSNLYTNTSRIETNSSYGDCYLATNNLLCFANSIPIIAPFTILALLSSIMYACVKVGLSFPHSCERCKWIHCFVYMLYVFTFPVNLLLNNLFLFIDWTQLTTNSLLTFFVLNLFQSILLHMVMPWILPKIMIHCFCRYFVTTCNYM